MSDIGRPSARRDMAAYVTDTHKFVLPDGFEIPVPPGENPDRAWVRHCYTAVSEGICPIHRQPLNEPPDDDSRPWCAPCGKWWRVDPSDGAVGWELISDPHELDYRAPWRP